MIEEFEMLGSSKQGIAQALTVLETQVQSL